MDKPDSTFNNKVIIITGASSGIGRALAIALSKYNPFLILAGRNQQELQKTKQLAKNLNPIQAHTFSIEKEEETKDFVKTVMSSFNQVDFLFNNAGLSQRCLVADTDIAIDRKLMEVNYFGNIRLTKLLLPMMQKQQSGHVVVTSSLAGLIGYYDRSAYCASKFALRGFYEALRLEEAKNNINVTLVFPGKVATNIAKNAVTNTGERYNTTEASIEEGMLSTTCANKIIRGVLKQKHDLYVGGHEMIAAYLKRFFPSLLYQVLSMYRKN